MGYSPDREWTDGGDIVLISCIEEEEFSIEEISELLKRSKQSVKDRINHLIEEGELSPEVLEELEKTA